jgi:hypothetical protein
MGHETTQLINRSLTYKYLLAEVLTIDLLAFRLGTGVGQINNVLLKTTKAVLRHPTNLHDE